MSLREREFHIFHYIGHGLYDPQSEDGLLLLEGEDERGRAVSGRELGTILHDCTSLRLAVLNACEGARSSRNDPFAGVAASLVQCEIPAVIAMQFEITDNAAVVFSEGFYEAVAAGFPVDAALAEARKAIYADHNDTEWGTPVLFMRVPDGRIFDIPGPPRLPAPDRLRPGAKTATPASIGETRVESPAPAAHPPAPPVEPPAPPSKIPEPPDHASRRTPADAATDPRSLLRLVADLAASASAALLLVALFLPWHLHPEDEPGSGWDVARHNRLMAVLVVAVLVLVWARRTGRLTKSAAPTAALALAGLFADAVLVLRGPGGIGPGRELAVYALLGIFLSGWLALATDASASFKSRRGELVSAVGALVVFSALFLDYATEETGWDYFGREETILGTLLGLVVLMALARLTLTNLGASKSAGALLLLVGVVVAQRVGYPNILHHPEGQSPDYGALGYLAALGGALIIISGGLIASLGDQQRMSRPE